MPFGSEILFGLDNFQKPKILDEKNSIAQVLLNILILRPGNLPSLPHIGINIKQYLYKFEDDLRADEIKQKIYEQCMELIPYLTLGDIRFFLTRYNEKDMFILLVPIVFDNNNFTVLYGFTNNGNEITFNYKIENEL